jgi:hypothetical protein
MLCGKGCVSMGSSKVPPNDSTNPASSNAGLFVAPCSTYVRHGDHQILGQLAAQYVVAGCGVTAIQLFCGSSTNRNNKGPIGRERRDITASHGYVWWLVRLLESLAWFVVTPTGCVLVVLAVPIVETTVRSRRRRRKCDCETTGTGIYAREQRVASGVSPKQIRGANVANDGRSSHGPEENEVFGAGIVRLWRSFITQGQRHRHEFSCARL